MIKVWFCFFFQEQSVLLRAIYWIDLLEYPSKRAGVRRKGRPLKTSDTDLNLFDSMFVKRNVLQSVEIFILFDAQYFNSCVYDKFVFAFQYSIHNQAFTIFYSCLQAFTSFYWCVHALYMKP